MNTSTSTGFHLIFGTGPAACWTARYLCEKGLQVKAVNRSGKRPELMPQQVSIIQADVSDVQQAIQITQGASVVYQALGPAYSQWAQLFPRLQANTIAAAIQANAKYVSLENLYMLDATQPIDEQTKESPRSQKGNVRLKMHHELMTHHENGDLQVSVLRASDFYGPGVTQSAMGDRALGNLVKGKPAQVIARSDCLHSFAYIGDVGKALATLGMAKANEPTWGKVWLAPHAPALTQEGFIAQACSLLNMQVKLSVVKPWMLHLVGLFNADAKASIEMLYQFEQPFTVDAAFSQNQLQLQPTAYEIGIKSTLEWFRKR